MISITNHAYEKAKERLSLTKKSLDKVAARALENGIGSKNFKLGSFKRYLDHLYFKYGSANNIKIYGDIIFLFSYETLITLYQMPNEYKKAVAKVFDRK